MIGLTAMIRALVSLNALLIPGTAKIGPMLVIGLLGQRMTADASRIESKTPGAGRHFSTPVKVILWTSSLHRPLTK
jgi:hypothetical protein